MKKFYAGIAAAAIAATGLVCSAGAAHADSAGWPSAYSIDPQDASVSLTLASSGGTAYAAWVDQTDETNTIIDVATTTLATGETNVHQVTASESVTDAAVTSAGTLVAVGHPDGSFVPDFLYGSVDDSTLNTTPISGTDQANQLAVSPNGDWAAIAGADDTGTSVLTVMDISGTPTASSQATLSGGSDIQDIAVTDSGTVYAAGTEYDSTSATSTNDLWTGTDPADPTDLGADSPESVAVLGDGTVAVGSYGDEDAQITYVAGGTVADTVALEDMYDINGLVASGQTLWAQNSSGQLSRIDGTSAQTFNTSYGELWDTAASPDGKTLYVVGAAWLPDANDGDGADGPASLFALTAPASPSDLVDYTASGAITVGWTPAAGTEDDLDYVVTLTDQATHEVHTQTQYSDNVDPGYASVDVDGVDPTHRYDVAVRAFNGAFYSTALTGEYLPPVTGEGHVSFTGAATVGSTLTAKVTGTWPAGATLSYQWMVVKSEGQSGGLVALPGDAAKHPSLLVTSDLVGKRIGVAVTAHQDGFTDSTATSDVVTVTTAAASTPAPVHVTKIKPATIKASAKKVKLKLPGINVAKAPGKVKVYDGKKLIGKAKIVNGKLVLKLKKHLHHGKHKLKLTYKGSAKVAKFNKKVKLKVK